MNDRVLSLLGLAAKGRNLRSGEFSTEKAVKEGSAAMVIIGNDASDNTKKKFTNMCAFYNTPIYFYSDKVQGNENICGCYGRGNGGKYHETFGRIIRHETEVVEWPK